MNAPVQTAPALDLESVSISFDGNQVVRDLSLRVGDGSVTALLGPNGAGKTTVLRAISGLVKPDSGRVRLFGEDLSALSAADRARRGLTHIPEGRGIYRNLTVRENLLVQSPRRTRHQTLETATSLFPLLEARIDTRAGVLSGGEQQMLALAAAFVRSPRLVVVDEVSLGLSPIVVDQMFVALQALVAEGIALLIVEQFVDRALAIAQDAYVMRKGEIAFSGPAGELRNTDIFDHYSSGTTTARSP